MVPRFIIKAGFLSFLIVLVVACGSSGRDSQPAGDASAGQVAGVSTPAAPEAPKTVEELPDVEGYDLSSVASMLEALTSYRLKMNLHFDGQLADGTPLNWQVNSLVTSVDEPPAYALELSVEGFDEATGQEIMQLVQTGEGSYLSMPGTGCVAGGNQAFGKALNGLEDPDTWLAGLTNAQLTSEAEIVNGVEVVAYSFDEQSLPSLRESDVVVDGRLYVAKDVAVVTQVMMAITGQADYLSADQPQDGSLQFELNVFDVNQPLVVELPDECLNSGGYPMLENASEITSLGEFITYKTSTSVEETVAFYQAKMVEQDWSAAEEAVIFEDSVYLSYERGEDTLTIYIEFDPELQLTTVLLSP